MSSKSVLATAMLLALAAAPLSAQCMVGAPSSCESLGPGHPGAEPPTYPSRLSWPSGSNEFLLQFKVVPGTFAVAVLSIGVAPQPAPLPAPPFCSPAVLYAVPQIILPAGNGPSPLTPGLYLLLPLSIRGTGIPVVLQGVATTRDGCLAATDGYRIEL
jgi:hypothetical protein